MSTSSVDILEQLSSANARCMIYTRKLADWSHLFKELQFVLDNTKLTIAGEAPMVFMGAVQHNFESDYAFIDQIAKANPSSLVREIVGIMEKFCKLFNAYQRKKSENGATRIKYAVQNVLNHAMRDYLYFWATHTTEIRVKHTVVVRSPQRSPRHMNVRSPTSDLPTPFSSSINNNHNQNFNRFNPHNEASPFSTRPDQASTFNRFVIGSVNTVSHSSHPQASVHDLHKRLEEAQLAVSDMDVELASLRKENKHLKQSLKDSGGSREDAQIKDTEILMLKEKLDDAIDRLRDEKVQCGLLELKIKTLNNTIEDLNNDDGAKGRLEETVLGMRSSIVEKEEELRNLKMELVDRERLRTLVSTLETQVAELREEKRKSGVDQLKRLLEVRSLAEEETGERMGRLTGQLEAEKKDMETEMILMREKSSKTDEALRCANDSILKLNQELQDTNKIISDLNDKMTNVNNEKLMLARENHEAVQELNLLRTEHSELKSKFSVEFDAKKISNDAIRQELEHANQQIAAKEDHIVKLKETLIKSVQQVNFLKKRLESLNVDQSVFIAADKRLESLRGKIEQTKKKAIDSERSLIQSTNKMLAISNIDVANETSLNQDTGRISINNILTPNGTNKNHSYPISTLFGEDVEVSNISPSPFLHLPELPSFQLRSTANNNNNNNSNNNNTEANMSASVIIEDAPFNKTGRLSLFDYPASQHNVLGLSLKSDYFTEDVDDMFADDYHFNRFSPDSLSSPFLESLNLRNVLLIDNVDDNIDEDDLVLTATLEKALLKDKSKGQIIAKRHEHTISKLETTCQDLSEALFVSNDRAHQLALVLHKTRETLLETFNQAQVMQKNFIHQRESLVKQAAELKNENGSLLQQFKVVTNELENTKSESLQATLAARKSALSTSNAIDLLSAEKSILSDELDRLKNDSNKKIQELNEQIKISHDETKDLLNQIATFRLERQELLNKLQEMTNVVHNLEAELQSRNLKIIQVDAELTSTKSNLSDCQTQLRESDNKKSDLERLLGGLKNRISEVEEDLKSSRETELSQSSLISGLRAQLHQSENAYSSLESQHSIQAEQLIVLDAKIVELKATCQTLRSSLETETSSLKESYEMNILSLNAQIRTLSKSESHYKRCLEEEQALLSNVQSDFDEASRKTSQLENKVKSLQSNCLSTERQLEDAEDTAANLEATVKQKSADVNDLRKKLIAAQETGDAAEARVAFLEAQVRTLSASTSPLESRLVELEGRLGESESIRQSMESRLKEVRQELIALRQVTSNLETKNSVLEMSRDESEGFIKDLNKELRELKDNIEHERELFEKDKLEWDKMKKKLEKMNEATKLELESEISELEIQIQEKSKECKAIIDQLGEEKRMRTAIELENENSLATLKRVFARKEFEMDSSLTESQKLKEKLNRVSDLLSDSEIQREELLANVSRLKAEITQLSAISNTAIPSFSSTSTQTILSTCYSVSCQVEFPTSKNSDCQTDSDFVVASPEFAALKAQLSSLQKVHDADILRLHEVNSMLDGLKIDLASEGRRSQEAEASLKTLSTQYRVMEDKSSFLTGKLSILELAEAARSSIVFIDQASNTFHSQSSKNVQTIEDLSSFEHQISKSKSCEGCRLANYSLGMLRLESTLSRMQVRSRFDRLFTMLIFQSLKNRVLRKKQHERLNVVEAKVAKEAKRRAREVALRVIFGEWRRLSWASKQGCQRLHDVLVRRTIKFKSYSFLAIVANLENYRKDLRTKHILETANDNCMSATKHEALEKFKNLSTNAGAAQMAKLLQFWCKRQALHTFSKMISFSFLKYSFTEDKKQRLLTFAKCLGKSNRISLQRKALKSMYDSVKHLQRYRDGFRILRRIFDVHVSLNTVCAITHWRNELKLRLEDQKNIICIRNIQAEAEHIQKAACGCILFDSTTRKLNQKIMASAFYFLRSEAKQLKIDRKNQMMEKLQRLRMGLSKIILLFERKLSNSRNMTRFFDVVKTSRRRAFLMKIENLGSLFLKKQAEIRALAFCSLQVNSRSFLAHDHAVMRLSGACSISFSMQRILLIPFLKKSFNALSNSLHPTPHGSAHPKRGFYSNPPSPRIAFNNDRPAAPMRPLSSSGGVWATTSSRVAQLNSTLHVTAAREETKRLMEVVTTIVDKYGIKL